VDDRRFACQEVWAGAQLDGRVLVDDAELWLSGLSLGQDSV
jgi:hypothetical protein